MDHDCACGEPATHRLLATDTLPAEPICEDCLDNVTSPSSPGYDPSAKVEVLV